MKKTRGDRWLFILIASMFISFAHGQCVVDPGQDTVVARCGDMVRLKPGYARLGGSFFEGFNDQRLSSVLWEDHSPLNFSDPCGAGADESVAYAWMGKISAPPRFLETRDLDLSCGGRVCFDLRMAAQGGGNPCEGPDSQLEGVDFQYSTDNGNSWTTIQFFDPDTNNAFGFSQFTQWDRYCFDLPSLAWTSNTRFRWIQRSATDSLKDHWGLDNIYIRDDCVSHVYNWGAGVTPDPDTLVRALKDTTYTLLLRDSSGNVSCDTSVYLKVLPARADLGSDTAFCPGDSMILSPAGDHSSYSWKGGSQDSQLTVYAAGTYWVEVVDGNGCVAFDTVDVREAVLDPKDFDAGPDSTICEGDTVQLYATGGVKYQWDPSPSLSDTTSAVSLAYPQEGTVYRVGITTAEGCRYRDSAVVDVTTGEACHEGLIIYNAFSPDGDGKNETWVIDGIKQFQSNKVIVFNRWGDKVRSFENYDNIGEVWDGKNERGRELPQGTYFYSVKLNDGARQFTGWVQLVR